MSTWQEIADALQEVGVDPATVVIGTMTRLGYLEETHPNPRTRIQVQREWPSPLAWSGVNRLLALDAERPT